MKYFLILLLTFTVGCGYNGSNIAVTVKSIPPPVPAIWNKGMVFDEDIKGQSEDAQSKYDVDNYIYFDGKLPEATVAWSWDKTEKFAISAIGVTEAWGECDHPKIFLNPRVAFSENMWEPVLLHEMMHVYMECITHENSGGTIFNLGVHSKAFHKHMMELACKGAFDDFGDDACEEKR